MRLTSSGASAGGLKGTASAGIILLVCLVVTFLVLLAAAAPTRIVTLELKSCLRRFPKDDPCHFVP